jgi:DNA-3-methyladenine glycosylase II
MFLRSWNTATILLSRIRLQRPSIFRSVSLGSLKYYQMSSRRSARLLAASSVIKDEATNGPAPPKVANTGRKRVRAAQETVEPTSDGNDVAPSTPKRKKASKPILPPVTPTPAAVGLMAAPYSSGDIDSARPRPIDRLALPNGTNATLVTPETHRVVASKPLDEVSPSKVSNVKMTTGNLLVKAHAHLIKTEPKLKSVIEKHYCHVFSPEGLAEVVDPFKSLVSGIISQQVRTRPFQSTL